MAEHNQDSALVTLANVKVFLGYKDTSDTSQDSLLNLLIAQCSAQVSNFCERKFATTTYTAETYDGTGQPWLYLRNWPITTMTSIYESSTRVFDATSLLDLESAGVGDYAYTTDEQSQGKVMKVNGGVWAKGFRTIQVTFIAGYSTIPSDVQNACFRLIALNYQRNIRGLHAVSSESITSGGGSITVLEHQMPKDVRELLVPYRRMRVGQ